MHQRCREWTRPQREWRRRQPPVPAAASGLHSCPKAESAAAPPAPRRSRSRGHPDPLSPAAGAPRAAGRTLTGPGATTRRSRAARVRGRSPTHRAETLHGGGGGSRGAGAGARHPRAGRRVGPCPTAPPGEPLPRPFRERPLRRPPPTLGQGLSGTRAALPGAQHAARRAGTGTTMGPVPEPSVGAPLA